MTTFLLDLRTQQNQPHLLSVLFFQFRVEVAPSLHLLRRRARLVCLAGTKAGGIEGPRAGWNTNNCPDLSGLQALQVGVAARGSSDDGRRDLMDRVFAAHEVLLPLHALGFVRLLCVAAPVLFAAIGLMARTSSLLRAFTQ